MVTDCKGSTRMGKKWGRIGQLLITKVKLYQFYRVFLDRKFCPQSYTLHTITEHVNEKTS